MHLYWGKRLADLADLPDAQIAAERSSQDPPLHRTREEYAPWGGLRYGETCAKVTYADGVRDLDLRFDRAEINDGATLPQLVVTLRDPVYALEVALHYQITPTHDVLVRWVTFTNRGSQPVTIERAFSAQWHLPASTQPPTLVSMAGQWGEEFQLQTRPVVAGTVLVETHRGITGPVSPWLAMAYADGEAYAVTLSWSGSWVLRATTTIEGQTAIVGGVHDTDFAWRLAPGEAFATPTSVAVFAADGLAGTRHRLQHYVREWVLPAAPHSPSRPVLYNSWEATFFAVNEPGQRALAARAAQVGVELFVVDDGWFVGRDDDYGGLGDWYADPQKFPAGLQPLIEAVHGLGMAFGLWVEPEMVNPSSQLYQAHPDWVYHFPTRDPSLARHQLVLNLGRVDVRAYLLAVLDQLVSEHPISYLKWDMNRPISEPGWSGLAPTSEAREVWVRHVTGVYAIMDALRERHPGLSIESCASGGSRADYGILARTDQVWTSDNTHPDARLLIQEGFAHLFPARVMSCWVTDTPSDRQANEIPLAYRAHVAMLGALGIGGNLTAWSAADLNELAHWVATYKRIRPVVQDGEQRWLWSPRSENVAAVQYISADTAQVVVFCFRRGNSFLTDLPPLHLVELEAQAHYRIMVDGTEMDRKTGAWLMGAGVTVPLARSSYTSCILELTRIDGVS